MNKFITLSCIGLQAACHSLPSTTTLIAPSPSATLARTQLVSDLKKEIEQRIAKIQENLPIKMNGVDLTDIKIANHTIYQSLTITNKNITSKEVPLAQFKRVALMECDKPDIKRFLSGGYDFIYTYHFQDKSQIEVRLGAKDCQ